MKKTWRWIGVMVILLSRLSPATPLKDPQRWVNAGRVDLTPLFEWWTKHSGERPLAAWVHVTGSIVKTNTWGWLVDAKVEDPTNASGKGESERIMIKNPPLREWAEFHKLLEQQHSLTHEQKTLASSKSEAQQHIKTLEAQQKMERHDHIRPSQKQVQEIKNWRQTEKQADERLKQVDQELKEIKPKLDAWPKADDYVVDCFALESKEKFEGVPVFDHGRSAGAAR